MIYNRVVIIVSITLISTMIGGATFQESEKIRLTWQPSLGDARKEAKRLERPLMVFVCERVSFWSEKMEATTFSESRVVTLLHDKFVLVKVFGEDNSELLKTHDIDSFPTMFFESSVGRVLGDNHVGYRNPDAMVQVLTKTLNLSKQSQKEHKP